MKMFHILTFFDLQQTTFKDISLIFKVIRHILCINHTYKTVILKFTTQNSTTVKSFWHWESYVIFWPVPLLLTLKKFKKYIPHFVVCYQIDIKIDHVIKNDGRFDDSESGQHLNPFQEAGI